MPLAASIGGGTPLADKFRQAALAKLGIPSAVVARKAATPREQKSVAEKQTSKEQDSLDAILEASVNITRPVLSGLAYVGSQFDALLGRRTRAALALMTGQGKGKNRWGELFSVPVLSDLIGWTDRNTQVTGSDLLGGWDDPDTIWDGVAEFGVEVLTDPLTFLPGAIFGAVNKGGKIIRSAGYWDKVGERAAKNAGGRYVGPHEAKTWASFKDVVVDAAGSADVSKMNPKVFDDLNRAAIGSGYEGGIKEALEAWGDHMVGGRIGVTWNPVGEAINTYGTGRMSKGYLRALDAAGKYVKGTRVGSTLASMFDRRVNDTTTPQVQERLREVDDAIKRESATVVLRNTEQMATLSKWGLDDPKYREALGGIAEGIVHGKYGKPGELDLPAMERDVASIIESNIRMADPEFFKGVKTGPVEAGDFVQWHSNGVDQFAKPKQVERIIPGPDGKMYATLVGEKAGVPLDELLHTGGKTVQDWPGYGEVLNLFNHLKGEAAARKFAQTEAGLPMRDLDDLEALYAARFTAELPDPKLHQLKNPTRITPEIERILKSEHGMEHSAIYAMTADEAANKALGPLAERQKLYKEMYKERKGLRDAKHHGARSVQTHSPSDISRSEILRGLRGGRTAIDMLMNDTRLTGYSPGYQYNRTTATDLIFGEYMGHDKKLYQLIAGKPQWQEGDMWGAMADFEKVNGGKARKATDTMTATEARRINEYRELQDFEYVQAGLLSDMAREQNPLYVMEQRPFFADDVLTANTKSGAAAVKAQHSAKAGLRAMGDALETGLMHDQAPTVARALREGGYEIKDDVGLKAFLKQNAAVVGRSPQMVDEMLADAKLLDAGNPYQVTPLPDEPFVVLTVKGKRKVVSEEWYRREQQLNNVRFKYGFDAGVQIKHGSAKKTYQRMAAGTKRSMEREIARHKIRMVKRIVSRHEKLAKSKGLKVGAAQKALHETQDKVTKVIKAAVDGGKFPKDRTSSKLTNELIERLGDFRKEAGFEPIIDADYKKWVDNQLNKQPLLFKPVVLGQEIKRTLKRRARLEAGGITGNGVRGVARNLHYNEFITAGGDKTIRRVLPEVVGDITKSLDAMKTPDATRAFLGWWGKLTNTIKTHLTVDWPAFGLRNLQGLGIMDWFYGPESSRGLVDFLNPGKGYRWFKRWRNAAAFHAGKDIDGLHKNAFFREGVGGKGWHDLAEAMGVKQKDVTAAWKDKQATEFLRMLHAAHGMSAARVGTTADRVGIHPADFSGLMDQLPGKGPQAKSYWSIWSNATSKAGAFAKRLTSGQFERADFDMLNPINTRGGFGKHSEAGGLSVFGLSRFGEQLNQHGEDLGRTATWLGLLDEGMDPYLAKARSDAIHVDYSKSTSFENRVKNVIPFYNYMRQMLGFMLRDLAEHPGGTTANIIRAINGNTQEGRRKRFVPQQLRGQLAIPLYRKDGKVQAYLKPDLPIDVINDMIAIGPDAYSTVQNTVLGWASMLHFIPKATLELGFGKSTYQRGRNLEEMYSRIGVKDPVMNQIIMASPLSRVATTAGPGGILWDERKSAVEKLSTLGLGVPVAHIDLEKAAAESLRDDIRRELRTEEGAIRHEQYFIADDEAASPKAKALIDLQNSLSRRQKALRKKLEDDAKKNERPSVATPFGQAVR